MYTNVNTPQKLTTWNRVCDNIDLIKVPSANDEEIEHEVKIYIDKDGKLYYYDNEGEKQYIEPTELKPPTTDDDVNSEQNVIIKDWTGTYPNVYVFVPGFDSNQPSDSNYYENEDIYVYKDEESLEPADVKYNIITKGGYFSLEDQKVLIPTYMYVSNSTNNWSIQLDTHCLNTETISGQYIFQRDEAKNYGCLNSKGEPSQCVLEKKALEYIKRLHICDALYYLIAAPNSMSSNYNKYIIYNDKETSYSFTVDPGYTLSVKIPQGYLYSITDQNGDNMFLGINSKTYNIGVATTGTKSTFTITLNPILEEDDNQ